MSHGGLLPDDVLSVQRWNKEAARSVWGRGAVCHAPSRRSCGAISGSLLESVCQSSSTGAWVTTPLYNLCQLFGSIKCVSGKESPHWPNHRELYIDPFFSCHQQLAWALIILYEKWTLIPGSVNEYLGYSVVKVWYLHEPPATDTCEGPL